MYASLILVGIAIVVFIIQAAVSGFTQAFALVSADVLTRPWILVTSIFLHGDIAHLLYNMLGLGLFGMILESIVGKKRFLVIFFAGGLLAGIGTSFLYSAALGASGALMAVLGVLAALRPHMQVFVSFIPMPMWVAAGFWAAGDFIGLFVPTGVANLAHLIGLGFGLGVGFYLRKDFGQLRPGREILHIDDKEFEDWEKKWMK